MVAVTMFVVTLFACLSLAPINAGAADLSAVYRAVKPGVAYIVCAGDDGVSSGSGFVYASEDASSTIIPAGHVVEGASAIDVILDSNPKHRFQATVLARDRVHDIAELSIPVGHRLALKLAAATDTVEGESIAAIGYPRAVKKFEELMGDELRPSVHSGIISAVRLNGQVLQFDAQTDRGDSGGAVIDARSGFVVGVVRGSLSDQSYLPRDLKRFPEATLR